MIKLTFNGSDARLLAALRARQAPLIGALTAKMAYLMLRLQQHIVNNKLSGQVLAHRSGKLAGSVRTLPVVRSGDVLETGVTAGGGPVVYAGVHEYGGTTAYEILPKTKKALAWFPQGVFNVQGGIAITRGMKQVTNLRRRARSIGKFQRLGGIVRKKVLHHPPAIKRPFMQPAMEEFRDTIVNELGLTIRTVLRG
jgi:hypothetical protein